MLTPISAPTPASAPQVPIAAPMVMNATAPQAPATPTLGSVPPLGTTANPLAPPTQMIGEMPATGTVTPATASAAALYGAAQATAIGYGAYAAPQVTNAPPTTFDPSSYFLNGAQLTTVQPGSAYYQSGATATSPSSIDVSRPATVHLQPGDRLSIYDYAGGRAAMPPVEYDLVPQYQRAMPASQAQLSEMVPTMTAQPGIATAANAANGGAMSAAATPAAAPAETPATSATPAAAQTVAPAAATPAATAPPAPAAPAEGP
jgi:hypothetical protein